MLFALLVLATVAAAGPVRKGLSPTFTEMVDQATVICVGTVDQMVTVPYPDGIRANTIGLPPHIELPFGRIRVERMLKGDPSVEVIYHEAWTTWSCDSTSGSVGERAIFFLGSGIIQKASDRNRAIAEAALGSKLIYRNLDDGGGIMRISASESGDWIWGSDATPLSLRLFRLDHRLRLDGAIDYIETLGTFAPEKCSVLAQQCGPAQKYDLRILPDGSQRLAIRFMDFERVTLAVTPAQEWAQLNGSIPALVGDVNRTTGDDSRWWSRRLEVRANGKVLKLFDNDRRDHEEMNRESGGGYVSALRAWALVRATFDCAVCADEREADAKLIAELTRK